jgi:TrmH family RNA methyltransferase
MKTITSVQNNEIQDITQLIHPSERKRKKRFIVEGFRAIETFVKAGHTPVQLYILENKLTEAKTLVDVSIITMVNESVLNRISQTSTPSGFVAVFKIPASPKLELEPGLVLANISDPGNMGTLIRTCAAMGKKSVVIIEGADVWSPKVIQASAGTLALVKIFSCSWQDLVKNKKDLVLTGLVVTGGKKPEEANLTKALLVVGSEAHGIPHEWLADCDELVTLPMPGETESLNAAVAGSIALYLAWNK